MQQINLQSVIPEEQANQRLDRCLASLFPQFSRSRLQDWLKNGQITIDGKSAKAKDKVAGGENIIIAATIEEQTRHQAQNIELDILYQDDDLIVINKPIGLVVHPAAGNPDGTLLNALLHHFPELADIPRAGIIHRLDKDTSGIMVVTRSLNAHTKLVADLQKHLIKREYLALAYGRFTAGGTINKPIDRHPKQRTKMAIVHNGKPAVTHYRVKQRFNDFTLLDVQLETGRTHQIRVHMADAQHPLVGDQTYAGRLRLPKNCSETLANTLRNFKHQALHAWQLTLTHPSTGEEMHWQAPIPEAFQQLLSTLATESRYANG